MKKTSAKTCLVLLSAAAILSLAWGCKKAPEKAVAPAQEDEYASTADAEIVAALSKGVLSASSSIMVEFVDDVVAQDKVGSAAPSKVVAMYPSAPGKFVWTDRRTLTFQPSKPLERGTIYKVYVWPDEIDKDRFAFSSRFYFHFSIKELRLDVISHSYSSAGTNNINELQQNFIITSTDTVDPQVLLKSLSVTLDGKKLAIEAGSNIGATYFEYVVKGIVKGQKKKELAIKLEKNPLGILPQTLISFDVPAITPLMVTEAIAKEGAERYVQVSFSDPLLASQDFRGLVSVKPARQLRFAVEGNILKVYSLSDWNEGVELFVKQGIKNIAGAGLEQDFQAQLSFKPIVPEARFIGNGVIVPGKAGVSVPIETVNLSGVIVRIDRIYANKIDQFLQLNELGGGKELERVGKTIWKKIVPVPFTEEKRNQWIRTALDLSPLVQDGNHDLYRLTISYDIRMSEYPGSQKTEDELMEFDIERLGYSGTSSYINEPSLAFWDSYASKASKDRRLDWDEYWDNYRNPVHPAFFSARFRSYHGEDVPDIEASRNFLVSDLGIIAQTDVNRLMTVAVASLDSADPVSGAAVSVYDFHSQLLASGTTDSKGLVSMNVPEGEFYLVAQTKELTGYLRLSGSSAIPLSNFDGAGQEVQQGVKGFIYGERGVWRPGDTIYLTFILRDPGKVLPAAHPVTLRFYDPSGKLVKSMTQDQGLGGFYQFTLKTDQDAPTGTYLAKVSVGGAGFSKEIPVETVKPNRLEIKTSFTEGLTELGTEPAGASITATWLHGAPAAGMQADVSVRFAPISTVFANYNGYAFDDPMGRFKSESRDIFSGNLDDQGKAAFTVDLGSGMVSPGKLAATFKTRVYEPGGNINADSFSIPFSPYPAYAGVSIPGAEDPSAWLNVDEAHEFRLALLDPAGKPIDGELQVSVYQIGWRWWWDMYEEEAADYMDSDYYDRVEEATVKVSKGLAKWSFKSKYRRWGRFYVKVTDTAGGHSTGKIFYMRWPGWNFSSSEGGGEAANILVFSSDKKAYKVGETARITLPSSEGGRALVSVENNGRLISTEWIQTKAGNTIYELKLTAAMTPNVYVRASLIQPHGQTSNDRPIRMFGVLPIMVEDPATKLSPALATSDSYEPNGKARITVSEKEGRSMTYTLAVVDEGLLNITHFVTPDPRAHFFRRDALAVTVNDIYGFVAAPYGGNLERLLAVGGGEEGGQAEGRKANRFPPMVRFLGPFSLDAGKSASHEISMPQYVGAVRVMLVAGNEMAYGFAEKSVPVKKPVMVYATLPRVMSVSESLSLPVTVFALEDGIKSIDVSLKTNDRLKVMSESKKTVKFVKSGDQLVTFEVASTGMLGIAEAEVTAVSGKVTSGQKIEIDVRSPNAAVTRAQSFLLKPSEKRDIPVSLIGLPGSNSVKLEASTLEPLDLERRLDFLIHYPYGCIEQTTSSVFPQLYLDKVVKLDEEQLAAVRKNVQDGINRLRLFLTWSGGLSYWPGGGQASAWGTTYAAHFLLEARNLGYQVPSYLIDSILSYLRAQVGTGNWNQDRSDYVQAYALYDLALAGQPDLGAMNRLRERSNLADPEKFKLAGAYALAGQKDAAMRLVGNKIPVITPYKELDYTYGSDTRDMAVLAEGFLESGSTELAMPLISDISKRLSSDSWYSTQTLAYSLVVIGKYLGKNSDGGAISLSYEWEGRSGSLSSGAFLALQELPIADKGLSRTLKIKNDSQSPVYLRLIVKGQPGLGGEKAFSNGLQLFVNYHDKDGSSLAVDSLPQGTDIIAELTVVNPAKGRDYQELAMEYIVPSGWEITNPRFEGWVQDKDKGFEYQDIRDDRVYTFFSLKAESRKTLKFMLTAAYAGKFYLPQSKAEAMYDASIGAATAGKWIEVKASEPTE
jgi:uncharacterized protein YfaS (alpha-2-macroglobulin family)